LNYFVVVAAAVADADAVRIQPSRFDVVYDFFPSIFIFTTMDGALLRILMVLMTSAAWVVVHSATVWFEDPPNLDDPCTIIVMQ
jgi:hypothetical protein